jgi:Flp pilus assembly pilin Flp
MGERDPKEARMFDHIRGWIAARRDEGQAMVEYALILFLVSIAAIAILGPLGQAVAGVLQQVLDKI